MKLTPRQLADLDAITKHFALKRAKIESQSAERLRKNYIEWRLRCREVVADAK